jgi:hypothetical protein
MNNARNASKHTSNGRPKTQLPVGAPCAHSLAEILKAQTDFASDNAAEMVYRIRNGVFAYGTFSPAGRLSQ